MRTPTNGIDYTDRDYEAYRAMLIAKLQEKMPEYTDTSETDAGIVILECLANGLDNLSMYNDIVANDVVFSTTQDRRLASLFAKYIGYTPKNQRASVIPQIFVLSETLDRDITIPKGTVVHTPESSSSVTIYFETMDDLTIPAGAKGDEKDLNGNYLYQVNCEQGSTVNEDVLGSSNGNPFQSFTLSYKNVLTDSIELQVNEGSGFETWTQVTNFIDSEQDSKHYIVTVDDFDNCVIQFGSGVRGKIPSVYDNGIIATYRIGGGTVGNVAANTVTVYGGTIAYVESTFNLELTTVGHEKETIEEIKENAPATFRTQDRAITEGDYGDLLRTNFYDFLSVRGVASTTVKLEMNIYYKMREGFTYTNELDKKVKAFLDTRIIPGTTYTINKYTPSIVNITANLIIDDDYKKQDVIDEVTDYVKNTYFGYSEFKFKDTFIQSELEHEIRETFAGVESFRITNLSDDIIAPANKNEILELGTLTLNVTGGKEK